MSTILLIYFKFVSYKFKMFSFTNSQIYLVCLIILILATVIWATDWHIKNSIKQEFIRLKKKKLKKMQMFQQQSDNYNTIQQVDSAEQLVQHTHPQEPQYETGSYIDPMAVEHYDDNDDRYEDGDDTEYDDQYGIKDRLSPTDFMQRDLLEQNVH